MATKKQTGGRGNRSHPAASLDSEIKMYVSQLESLSSALNSITPALSERVREDWHAMDVFIRAKGIKRETTEGSISYILEPSDLGAFERHNRRLRQSSDASGNVRETFLVALLCRYDAYLGRLLRTIFEKKPELINVSERTLTLRELISLKSIKAASEAMIEREVEGVLHKSHTEHFDYMEKCFGIELRKDLSCWPVFIELTERRNLFVHCDGVVSARYLDVCRKHKAMFSEDVRRGERLHVTQEYFDASFDCLLELGVKLGQVLWRKLFPMELETADTRLNNVCFDLLVDSRHDLARLLLDFGVNTLKKHSSALNKQTLIVNLAQSYKWTGNQAKCCEVLNRHDWTASNLDFQMAVAVLRDQYDAAAQIMKQMGKDSKIGKTEYTNWPLFREFIKSRQFTTIYKAVFGDDFLVTETPATAPPREDQKGTAKQGRSQKMRIRKAKHKDQHG